MPDDPDPRDDQPDRSATWISDHDRLPVSTPAVARTIAAGLFTAGRPISATSPPRTYATRLLQPDLPHHLDGSLFTPTSSLASDLNESPFQTPVKNGTDLPVRMGVSVCWYPVR